MRMERAPSGIDGRLPRAAAALAGLTLAAACSGGAGPPESVGRAPEVTAAPPATAAPASPVPSAANGPEGCDSVRAVQPGLYFNQARKPQIEQHLGLLRTAYTPGSNVDISRDGYLYFQLLHWMENDPEYAAAMDRASSELKAAPGTKLDAAGVLQWPVEKPVECAPGRLTDADSRLELMRTRRVAAETGTALLGHLADQGSRLATGFKEGVSRALRDLDERLAQIARR